MFLSTSFSPQLVRIIFYNLSYLHTNLMISVCLLPRLFKIDVWPANSSIVLKWIFIEPVWSWALVIPSIFSKKYLCANFSHDFGLCTQVSCKIDVLIFHWILTSPLQQRTRGTFWTDRSKNANRQSIGAWQGGQLKISKSKIKAR